MDDAMTQGEGAAAGRSVLLIDAATLTRECLADMLRRHAASFTLDSTASPEAAGSVRPQAVLLNIHAARVDEPPVLQQLAAIRARFPGVPVAVIAAREDAVLPLAALRLQLRGYLPTSLSPDTLAAAVALMLAGGTYIPPPPLAGEAPGGAGGDGLGLTRREQDVLALLRQGKPNKLIGRELAISEATVKVHVRSIMSKLRAHNRTQLAVLGSVAAPRTERSAA